MNDIYNYSNIPIRESKCNDCDPVYQMVKDSKLNIYVSLPGIDKKTLQVRTKTDVVAITAEYNDKLGKIFSELPRIDIRIRLIRSVDMEKSKVEFVTGILHIVFDLNF
ncbi:MAG: Hsp20/alpha crystallin family protein [Bacteroidales bacterium]|nr:Hsp20/alpha crystallin family protein [Bacteroidales bacterium]